MELHFETDITWFEPLKDDTSTPRYKQVSSPRIFFQDEITPSQISQRRHSSRTSEPSTPRHQSSEPSTPRYQNSAPPTPRYQNSAPSTPRNQNSEPSTPRYVKSSNNSAHSSLRSTQYIKTHTSSRPLLRHNSSVRSQKLIGSNHWRPSTFDDIRSHCLEHGKLYEDPVFPADEGSLCKNTKLNIRNVKWKRPHEIVRHPKFVVNTVCDMNIEPGKLGDCWLVSAFTCLSMAPKLLQKCVPLDQGFHDDKYAGIFHFRFWRFGEWIDVVVDDRLPTIDDHILYMRSSNPDEFWPALFEKAYAKLYGSYDHIYGGRVCWALQDITGGITNTHSVTVSSRHLITVIDLAMSRASLIGGYISTSKTGNMPGVLLNGLKTGHTYSITGYAEIPVTGGRVILLRLRNPILNVLWNGAWSKRSPHWKVLNEKTRKRLKVDNMLDGEFWMSFVDFQKIFTEIEICHLGPESWKEEPGIQHRGIWTSAVAHRQWRNGFNSGGCVNAGVMCNNNQFYVELKKPMAMIVSLMQKYKTTDESRKYQSCTCLIYKVQRGLESRLGEDFFLHNRVYASTKFKQCRENVHTFVLSEGSYLIMPVTEIEGLEGRYMLRFYTAGDSIIK